MVVVNFQIFVLEIYEPYFIKCLVLLKLLLQKTSSLPVLVLNFPILPELENL